MDFYKTKLLDHYKKPRNFGKLENPTISTGEYIPSCGDSVEIQAIINNNNLEKIAFTGKGCVISQASASMLLESCYNKNIEDILLINEKDILKMITIELGPTRLKCAILALIALQNGIKEFKKQNAQ